MSIFKEKLQAFYPENSMEIVERDILRVSGIIGREGFGSPFDATKTEILKWVKNRAGGELPDEANRFEDFFVDVAGRNVECRAEDFGDVQIWGLRAEDPDKNVPGRIWKTEIIVAKSTSSLPRMSLRLRVTNKGFDDQFIPSSPGVVNQIIERVGLRHDVKFFSGDSTFINSDEEFEDFLEYLENEGRKMPIVLLSQIPRKTRYSIKPAELTRKLYGLAHVFCISDNFTWKLSNLIGRKNSVFDGGIKVYYPSSGSSTDEIDPSTQRLITRSYIEGVENANTPIRLIVSGIAEHSLNTQRLGREVISFSEFSTNLRKHRISKIETSLGSDQNKNELIEALRDQISSLENELQEKTEMESLALDENENLRQELEESIRQQNNFRSKLQSLENAVPISETIEEPESWDELTNWVETEFAGKIVLTPSARRGIKKAKFQDLKKVVQSINWLATHGIQGRTSNTGETLKEANVTDGIIHAHCGGDTYEFSWQGNRFQANWHIKSSGNTHDPTRCLRIYYAWDPQSQQIIISDLPAHRKTDAS